MQLDRYPTNMTNALQLSILNSVFKKVSIKNSHCASKKILLWLPIINQIALKGQKV